MLWMATYLAKVLCLRSWMDGFCGAQGRVPFELRADAVVGEHGCLGLVGGGREESTVWSVTTRKEGETFSTSG